MRMFLLAASSALISSSAIAADAVYIDTAPAPVVTQAPYDWTGPYVGVHGGVTTGDFEYEAGPDGGPGMAGVDISGGGFIGGVQAGYDWQSGAWVFGAVADIAATNHEASLSADIGGDSIEAESQLKYLGTVRARIGRAFDRTLIYGHGGFAYGKTEQEISALGSTLFDESQTRTGWTIGAGLEYAITDSVSFGTEYSYVDLGNEDVYSDDVLWVEEDLAFHTVKASLNFRF